VSLAYPLVLLLVALLVPLGARLAARRERDRRTALERFGDPGLLARSSALPDLRRSAVGAALQVAALALGLLALGRPQLGDRPSELARTGRDVLVVLDLSRSMNVTDVVPSRLAAAKRAAWAVTSASPGDRVGLIVFGGSAFLQLPLTTDHGALRLFLDAASSDDLGDPATDISAALGTAARAFEHEGEEGRRAVLIVSDGESGEGGLEDALVELRRQQIPVFAIGVGTAAGGPVPADSSEAPEKYHRDHAGRVVISRLELGDLRRAAEATGGVFARWEHPEEIRRLEEGLARVRVRTLTAQKSHERADRFQWPLAVAVLLLLLEGLARRRVQGRLPATAAVAMAALWAGGCSLTARGERLYADGKYAQAYDAFRAALERRKTPVLAYDAGNALYRMRRYQDAAKQFKESAAEESLRQRSYYNLGNALVRASEEATQPGEPLRQAIAAYEAALRLDPGDTDAKWNLEIALRRLGDDRTSGGSPGRGRNADYGRGNMNTPGYEGNPEAQVGAMAGGGFGSAEGESAEELTPEQARQLLESVQRQELSSHEGRPSDRGPKGDRDW
jgi:Ca-activated chloride channel family protein